MYALSADDEHRSIDLVSAVPIWISMAQKCTIFGTENGGISFKYFNASTSETGL